MKKVQGMGWTLLGTVSIVICVLWGIVVNQMLKVQPEMFYYAWEPVIMKTLPWACGSVQLICFWKAWKCFSRKTNELEIMKDENVPDIEYV